MAAGALVPIVIVGLGAKLVAPHIAKMLINKGRAKETGSRTTKSCTREEESGSKKRSRTKRRQAYL